MKTRTTLAILALLLGLFFVGCNSTRYVPDGAYLLQKVEIDHDARNISKEELKSFVRPKENIRIIGFWRFHLGMYNLSGKDSSQWYNKWLRRIGEAPVLYDEFMKNRSHDQLKLFLSNKGYFNARVSDTLLIHPKKKKLKVKYTIHTGEQSLISNLGYKIADEQIRELVYADTLKSLLRRNKPFDTDRHDKERDRITRNLQSKGYYNFSKEYIYFDADSMKDGRGSITDTLVIASVRKTLPEGRDSLVSHAKSRIKDVFFLLDFNPQEALRNENEYLNQFDTLHYAGCYLLHKGEIDFKPDVLINSNYIFPGQFYDVTQVKKTQQLLTGLKQFRYINIRFKQLPDEVDEEGYNLLQCYIQLSPSRPQSYAFEIEGTNSSGNLGAAGNIKYQHKNLLKGAEILDVQFRLASQNQFSSGSKSQFNTLEIGLNTALTLPKFLVPFKIEGFRKKFNPRSTVSMAYNYQRRPDYTRTIANARLSYDWSSSSRVKHMLSIADFNLVNIPTITDEFWDYIKDTFLKYSYEDHLIVNTNYTYQYSEQSLGSQQNFWYFKGYAESAGNVLDAFVSNVSKENNQGHYEFMGIRYAQYVKADIDVRYHHYVNNINSFAYRFFAGVGYPYGNLQVLPFEKRYFSGGANSIRAWPVRALGPGTYKEEVLPYYNQTADVKLEWNAEYRFKLFWVLEGALFADIGNIWSIRESGSPEGGLFKWNSFYKQLAVGVGAGTRFDFNYFVFRLDMGIKARDPSLPAGDRWILGRRPLNWNNDFAFNFAIGYPF
jgi:outer membrane protein assembly factor BamA